MDSATDWKTFVHLVLMDSFEDKSSEDESLEDYGSRGIKARYHLYITASSPRIADNDFIVRLIGEQFNKLKHGDLIDASALVYILFIL